MSMQTTRRGFLGSAAALTAVVPVAAIATPALAPLGDGEDPIFALIDDWHRAREYANEPDESRPDAETNARCAVLREAEERLAECRPVTTASAIAALRAFNRHAQEWHLFADSTDALMAENLLVGAVDLLERGTS